MTRWKNEPRGLQELWLDTFSHRESWLAMGLFGERAKRSSLEYLCNLGCCDVQRRQQSISSFDFEFRFRVSARAPLAFAGAVLTAAKNAANAHHRNGDEAQTPLKLSVHQTIAFVAHCLELDQNLVRRGKICGIGIWLDCLRHVPCIGVDHRI